MSIPGETNKVNAKEEKKELQKENKKEDRRIRRTKKMLTQALTQLMEQKQINEITVKELTDLADMNRGTFYIYYRDIYDMLEKIEDDLFEKLSAIVDLHEHEPVISQTKSILLDLFSFIEENQEMCRVLLSPNGDMNFLHRLNKVLRENCLHFFLSTEPAEDESVFDYHYSFVVFGCAGIIRSWVSRNCLESAQQMAEMTNEMILRGGFESITTG